MAFFLHTRNLSTYIRPHARGPRLTSQSLAGFSPHNALCGHAQLCPTLCPWTVARQAPLSMGFSRQKYWSGLPFPSPGDLPDPGIEPRSPALQKDSLLSEPPGKPIMPCNCHLFPTQCCVTNCPKTQWLKTAATTTLGPWVTWAVLI